MGVFKGGRAPMWRASGSTDIADDAFAGQFRHCTDKPRAHVEYCPRVCGSVNELRVAPVTVLSGRIECSVHDNHTETCFAARRVYQHLAMDHARARARRPHARFRGTGRRTKNSSDTDPATVGFAALVYRSVLHWSTEAYGSSNIMQTAIVRIKGRL